MKFITLIFLFAHQFSSLAQSSKPERGAVFLNDGTIINGWIKHKEIYQTPGSVLFGTDKLFIDKKYTVSDLKGFEISGKKKFIRAVVDRCMNCHEAEMSNYPNIHLENKTDTLFLELLASGKIASLYLFSNEDSYWLFLKTGDREPFEIVDITYRDDNGIVYETNYFKGQLYNLSFYSPAYYKIRLLIEKARYSRYALIDIINEINSTTGEPYYSQPNEKARQLFAFAGLAAGYTTLYDGTSYADFKLKKGTAAGIYGGVDCISNTGQRSLFHTWTVRLSGLIARSDYLAEELIPGDKIFYQATDYSLVPQLHFYTSLFWREQFQVNGGIGAEWPITIKYGIVNTTEKAGIKNINHNKSTESLDHITFSIAGNICIANKWELGATGQLMPPLLRFGSKLLYPNIYYMWVCYRFN